MKNFAERLDDLINEWIAESRDMREAISGVISDMELKLMALREEQEEMERS